MSSLTYNNLIYITFFFEENFFFLIYVQPTLKKYTYNHLYITLKDTTLFTVWCELFRILNIHFSTPKNIVFWKWKDFISPAMLMGLLTAIGPFNKLAFFCLKPRVADNFYIRSMSITKQQ